MSNKNRFYLRKYVTMAVFVAVAYISLYILPIKGIGGFLTFDIKDAIMTIAAMMFGPIAGIAIVMAVTLLECITIGVTGLWGLLMNFVSSAVFCLAGSVIYRYAPKLKHTLSGAIVGLTASILLMTAAMIPMNLIVTPIYANISVDDVKALILPLLLPFNIIKGLTSAAIVMVLYKPLSVVFKRFKILSAISEGKEAVYDKKTIFITVICGIVVILGILIMILVLNGHIKIPIYKS